MVKSLCIIICIYWYEQWPGHASVKIKSNHFKSNHFYCHITTAQVPWWVKFLWACSRQCKKTTDNLPMDRQCKKNNKQFTYGQTVQKTTAIYLWTDSAKKTTNNLPMDRQCKKNNKQFTYGQTVQKTTAIYLWTDSAKKTTNNLHMDRQCKKNNKQFTYGQTVQKKTTAIYIWTDSAKKQQTIYIWTVHIYRLYRRQCAKYTYIYSVRLVYYRDILNYQR